MPMNHHSSNKVAFVGSFDPFHEGHKNIVTRALTLFDEVIIGVSNNDQKQYAAPISTRVKAIQALYHGCPRVVVAANDGLTVDFARRHAARCIIKGIRNVDDYRYERDQALWNKQHGGIETLLLVADEGLETVSSTAIRADDKL